MRARPRRPTTCRDCSAGSARSASSIPAAPGLWHSAIDIGVRVFKGFVVGHLNGEPITAPLDGVLRGVVRDGVNIPCGVKVLEIDPRGRSARWTGIDERSALVASAVSRAIRVKLAERDALLTPGPFVAH